MGQVTNVSTAVTTNGYWDDVVVGFRDAAAPLFSLFTMDASDKAAARNKTVTPLVFVVSGSTVTDFNGSNGFVMNASGRKGIAVTLDRYRYSSAALTQTEVMESSIISLKQSARANVYELVNNVFYDNLNYISSSNVFPTYGTTFASASSVTYSSIVDLRTTAVGTYLWNGPAHLVVNSKVFGALLKDTTLANSATRGLSDVTTGGDLFRVINNPGGGWTSIVEAPSLPFTNNVVGYAVTPKALVTCLRYWAPPEGFTGKAVPITEPKYGITLGYREWASEDMDEARSAFTALWGKAVINENAALIIKATSNT